MKFCPTLKKYQCIQSLLTLDSDKTYSVMTVKRVDPRFLRGLEFLN